LRLDNSTWSFNWQKSSQVALNKKLVAVKSSKNISERLKNIISYNEFIPYYKALPEFVAGLAQPLALQAMDCPSLV